VTKHRINGRRALLSSNGGAKKAPDVDGGKGAYPSPANVGARARPIGTSSPACDVRRARGEPLGGGNGRPLPVVVSSVSSWMPIPVIWRMRGCGVVSASARAEWENIYSHLREWGRVFWFHHHGHIELSRLEGDVGVGCRCRCRCRRDGVEQRAMIWDLASCTSQSARMSSG
jgi:hypothetical protein